ncbi:MAG: hypothetical protein VXW43_19670, partial [Pseudomonadota bacterium]|nr:hypothetical protein [Pseudomonadota bacterium]
SADLFSLVECDYYEEFFKPELDALGYDSVYKKRPRPSSTDGCAIFFRRGVFKLIASQDMEFVDKKDPATGKPLYVNAATGETLTERPAPPPALPVGGAASGWCDGASQSAVNRAQTRWALGPRGPRGARTGDRDVRARRGALGPGVGT